MSMDRVVDDPVPTRPLPAIEPLTEGFWAATAGGELAIQRCAECRRFQHPPRAMCPRCGSPELAFETVSGEGRLYSWTVSDHRIIAGLEDASPYVSLLVELAEQDGLLVASDFLGDSEQLPELRIGLPMHVEFLKTADPAIALPRFAFSGAA